MSKLEDLRQEFERRISLQTEPGWRWTGEERKQLAERLEDVWAEIVKTAGDLAVESYRSEGGSQCHSSKP